MIEKTNGYKVGTQFFPTLVEAQKEALKQIVPAGTSDTVLGALVSNASKVCSILNPPKELRVRATRRDKGTRRPTKPVSAPAPGTPSPA